MLLFQLCEYIRQLLKIVTTMLRKYLLYVWFEHCAFRANGYATAFTPVLDLGLVSATLLILLLLLH